MDNQVFLVVEATPNLSNQDELNAYSSLAPVLMKKHGGTPVSRYVVESKIGAGEHPKAIAVISFPNKESVDNFLVKDPEYQKLIPLRNEAFSEIHFYVCREQV